jgi:ankyrin repeat protein
MENATTYLTTWGCSPNVTDKETGLTPLHLAVISGNPRVVRRLLIKGADKTLKVIIIHFLNKILTLWIEY